MTRIQADAALSLLAAGVREDDPERAVSKLLERVAEHELAAEPRAALAEHGARSVFAETAG